MHRSVEVRSRSARGNVENRSAVGSVFQVAVSRNASVDHECACRSSASSRLMARAGLLLDGVGRLLMLSVDGSEDTEAD